MLSGAGGRSCRLGADGRTAAAADFFLFLEGKPPYFGFFSASGQKNFKKDKILLCKLEKIGYNKVVLPSESAAEDRR